MKIRYWCGNGLIRTPLTLCLVWSYHQLLNMYCDKETRWNMCQSETPEKMRHSDVEAINPYISIARNMFFDPWLAPRYGVLLYRETETFLV